LVESHRTTLQKASIELPSDLVAVCDDVSQEWNPSPGQVDIALATQLSFDRIHSLPRLIALWTGPLSIVVYLQDAELADFNRFLSANAGILADRERLAFHLVFRDDDNYPVNYLRNFAIQQVQTHYVLNLDIDFLVNQNAYQLLQRRLNTKLFDVRFGNSMSLALILAYRRTTRLHSSFRLLSQMHTSQSFHQPRRSSKRNSMPVNFANSAFKSGTRGTHPQTIRGGSAPPSCMLWHGGRDSSHTLSWQQSTQSLMRSVA
jgi:hypothetical protein